MGRKGKRKQRSSGETPPKGVQKQLKMSEFVEYSSQVDAVSEIASDVSGKVFTSPTTQSNDFHDKEFPTPDEHDITHMLSASTSEGCKLGDTLNQGGGMSSLPMQDSQIIHDIHKKLDSLVQIKAEVLELKQTIKDLVEAVQFSEAELNKYRQTIISLKQDNSYLKDQTEIMKCQTTILKNKVIEQENYSRRENIVIRGVKECQGENCLETVRELLSYMDGENIAIQRCHRVGVPRNGQNRDIIVRLVYSKTK